MSNFWGFVAFPPPAQVALVIADSPSFLVELASPLSLAAISRCVGILHEINSDDSAVSPRKCQVLWLPRGRKGKPDEEVAPSDQIYEYIIFRGTDVKDLRIEEDPGAVKENKPPSVPSDPAIVNVSSPLFCERKASSPACEVYTMMKYSGC